MCNSQLTKLKSGIKNGTEVTLKISLNVVGESNDENNFPHKLLLTNTQFLKVCKVFANGLSANIKSKSQLHKIGQSGGFLGRLLKPLLKTGLPLIGNVLLPLAKSVLIPVGLTASASATDAAIHKKLFESSHVTKVSDRVRLLDLAARTTLIISNEEMNDIMKIIKSLEESGLSIKGLSETITNELQEQKGVFTIMLLGTLRASFLGNLLIGKGAIAMRPERKSNMPGRGTTRAGEGTVRAGEGTIREGQDF